MGWTFIVRCILHLLDYEESFQWYGSLVGSIFGGFCLLLWTIWLDSLLRAERSNFIGIDRCLSVWDFKNVV